MGVRELDHRDWLVPDLDLWARHGHECIMFTAWNIPKHDIVVAAQIMCREITHEVCVCVL